MFYRPRYSFGIAEHILYLDAARFLAAEFTVPVPVEVEFLTDVAVCEPVCPSRELSRGGDDDYRLFIEKNLLDFVELYYADFLIVGYGVGEVCRFEITADNQEAVLDVDEGVLAVPPQPYRCENGADEHRGKGIEQAGGKRPENEYIITEGHGVPVGEINDEEKGEKNTGGNNVQPENEKIIAGAEL